MQNQLLPYPLVDCSKYSECALRLPLLSAQEGHVVCSLEEQYNLSQNPDAQEEEIIGRLRHILFKQFLEGLNEQPVEFEQVQDPCDTEEC